MRRHFNLKSLIVLLAAVLAAGLLALPFFGGIAAQQAQSERQSAAAQIKAAAQQQIAELIEEKRSRTPAQRKLSSQLIYAQKESQRQAVTNSVESLRTSVNTDTASRALVDIRGTLSNELRAYLQEVGGEVVYHSPQSPKFRARVPLGSLEEIAAWPEVKSIRPAAHARTDNLSQRARTSQLSRSKATVNRAVAAKPVSARAAFAARIASIKGIIGRLLNGTKGTPATDEAGVSATVSAGPPYVTEGDITHRAREARSFFGVSGQGVKIGVLSDSSRFLEDSIALGALPPDVTVLDGESGTDLGGFDAGEGTAMLEIIHALAPDAKLFFATAFRSPESFADNIRALRAAGCDIIVDDVGWSNETAFQDSVIAQAVNDVTRDGALYFSSAGNAGNFNDGTSTVWEGDYKDGGELPILNGGRVHDFGDGTISNRVRQDAGALILTWADPLGESVNDYDLFVLNSNFTRVMAASTDMQDGEADPFEEIDANFSRPAAFAGEQIVIFNYNGAAPRALRLDTFNSAELTRTTPGQILGHAAAADAFAVAAVDVATVADPFGFGSPFFTGGPTNPIEFFSSDGPRRVFFDQDGRPITPGNFLFATNGGTVRQKPDIAAADGGLNSTPGFFPFFGTSAAAPHAAAIAALVKSAVPNITPQQVRSALQSSALDIRAPGVDRDSGSGIVMALQALQASGAPTHSTPLLRLSNVEIKGSDGTTFVDPGESGAVNFQLVNAGALAANNVKATLTSASPGVTITDATSNYPRINAPGNATNATPFGFAIGGSVPVGQPITLRLAVTADELPTPAQFKFTLLSGRPGKAVTVSYSGPAVAIPDEDENGVNVPVAVSGLAERLWDVNFRVGGTGCTATPGATTVGIDHTWVGDLTLTLISPGGTRVKLMNRPGGVLNSGINFCNTLLDDESLGPWIQIIFPSGPVPLGPPYTGTFKPALPLAAFKGQNANGAWRLNVADGFGGDTGRVRSFSIILTPATRK